MQVAVIDADDLCSSCNGCSDLLSVVGLHQGRHPQLGAQVDQLGQLRWGENVNYQKVGVGADGAGFVHLVGVEQEVLAQHGNGSGCAAFLDRGQMLRFAKEMVVGDHRDSRCAVVRVRGGEFGGVEVLAQQAFRRRRFLDLRDEADAFTPQGAGEVQRGRARGYGVLQR